MDYNRENETDLFKECMRQITKNQVLDFKVSGRQVRMDSKLIGSNITWYTRYELVHEILALFIEERSEHIYKRSLSREEFDLIDHIMDEEGSKFIYRSNKKEVDTRFVALGRLMCRFIKLFKRHDHGTYQTGYELTPSEENPDELVVLDTKTRIIITACLAATTRIDSQTGTPVKKWRIKTDDGKYRYFTMEDVRTSMLRQKLRDVPIEKKWKRNNVEATIFQLGYNLNNGKTRYRGLAANRLWAYSRATWINFRRILKYVMQASKRTLSSQKGLCFIINKWINIQNNINLQINNFLNSSRLKYLNFSHF